MEIVLERCAGLDVHRDSVVACFLCENAPSQIRIFSTLPSGLEQLRQWLEELNCRHVAMESTGVYWQPVYQALEGAFNSTMVILVTNARHMRNVPGRKTDMKDAEWIASLLRAGLLKGSFIPSQPVRELRDFT
ncbi:MAG: IS110 family transposase, partial [Negativicutes bacterium]|nr:IS110 family transposase [Negativicutes bacterium]